MMNDDAIILERITACVTKKFDRETAKNISADIDRSPMAAHPVLRLWGMFDSEPVEYETVTFAVDVPASWWDMFKAGHFPNWLLRIFPAKTRSTRHQRKVKHSCAFPVITTVSDRHRVAPFVRRAELLGNQEECAGEGDE